MRIQGKVCALVLLALVMFGAAPAAGQTVPKATANMSIAWDQAAATLAGAQELGYVAFVNGSAEAIAVVATCTGTASPFVCKTPLPAALTVLGDHDVVIAARLSLGSDAWTEEARSDPFAFQVVALPAPPARIRLERSPAP